MRASSVTWDLHFYRSKLSCYLLAFLQVMGAIDWQMQNSSSSWEGGFTGYARGSRGERRRAACKVGKQQMACWSQNVGQVDGLYINHTGEMCLFSV